MAIISVFTLLIVNFLTIFSMEKNNPTYKGIKIGFELETGTFKYRPNAGERNLRHKKILTAEKGGLKLWHLEVDSDNEILELNGNNELEKLFIENTASHGLELLLKYYIHRLKTPKSMEFQIGMKHLCSPMSRVPISEMFTKVKILDPDGYENKDRKAK
ncbi:MAG: hypothetical protein ACTSXG_00200 [Alphaproteobacteria bacterium]